MAKSRGRHPDPDIENAVRYAESLGWTVRKSSGHAWARLYCPHSTRDGCILSVWSTPRSPGNHARHIRSVIDKCPHTENRGDPHDATNPHAR